MKREQTEIPIYKGTLVMILADDLSELNEEYGVKFTNSYGAGVFNQTDEEGYTKFIVAFDNDWTYSLIAHEAVHLVNDIFKHKNLKLDVDNDEAQAYFTQWIFEKCEEFLNQNENNGDRSI